jgi:DNA-binding NarL/FixJ family response regulator
VAIVEDNADFRIGLRQLVDSVSWLQCEGEYTNAEEAIVDVPYRRPDVVLMDLDLPGMSGVECTGWIKRTLPDTQILVLTVFDDDDKIFNSLSSGANGYILKSALPDDIIGAIREIHNGGAPMSSRIARRVVQAFHRESSVEHEEFADLLSLTRREQEILGLLAQGYLYREIGEKLFISLATVRGHIHKIYDKLHVRSRTEAVIFYQKSITRR